MNPSLPTPPPPARRPGRTAPRAPRTGFPRLGAALLAAPLVAAALACGSGDAALSAPGPQSQMEFGVKMAQRGLWSEALFRFEQAQRQAPGDPRVLNNLAVAYEATGQFDKALASYQQALQAAPTNRELRRNYARFVEFYQSFRPQEAAPETADGDAGGSAAAADGGGA